jgi:DNA polymerase III epsilon subunit-like protein
MQIKMPPKYQDLSVIEIMLCNKKALNFEAMKLKKLTFDAPEKFMAYLKGQPDKKETAMYLFFDTETTGLPKRYDAKITDLDNWPRLVQLAWLAYDTEGNKVDGDSSIVKPSGFTIPDQAARIHGITTDKAMFEGKDLQVVLELLHERISQAEILVAHNMNFDEKIIAAEFVRLGIPAVVPPRRKICTMTASARYCNLNGPRGPKWPKLQELHVKLFGENFSEAHNAAADIAATARCFFELKRLGVISI